MSRSMSAPRQVVVLGAGPAGLTLANLLRQAGVDCLVLEQRDRRHIETRQRAGAIEQRNVELLNRYGLADRLLREANPRPGCEFRMDGRQHFMPYSELYGDRKHYFYPQHELVSDLVAAYLRAGGEVRFEADDVRPHGFDGDTPSVTFQDETGEHSVHCDFIAGCDGFHGVSRPSIPDGVLTEYSHSHGIGWLGILASAPPSAENNVYALHPRGFAGHMLRSETTSRYFLQVEPDEDVQRWPDERVWAELRTRFALDDGSGQPIEGPIFEKRVHEMRSVVFEPMSYGRLYLAGDAAHIITPVGAKGMNLALYDVEQLAAGFVEYYKDGTSDVLRRYTELCASRVWRYQEFSQWMTEMIHTHAGQDGGAFRDRLARSRLDHLLESRRYAASFAENYLGLD